MSGAIDAAGADWPALRRRFAGEALANVLAFCGCSADCRRREGGGEEIRVTADSAEIGCMTGRRAESSRPTQGPAIRKLPVGAVALLWKGTPLRGEPPDWPRSISPAAARFFLTARPLAEPVPLDLDLAARRDEHDPCYFTRYTHKRLCALLSRRSPEAPSAPPPHTEEGRALVLAIDRFPAAVRRGWETLDPYPVNRYAVALSGEVWRFLRACPPTEEARPLLAAARTALGNALVILRVAPPRTDEAEAERVVDFSGV